MTPRLEGQSRRTQSEISQLQALVGLNTTWIYKVSVSGNLLLSCVLDEAC